jgi:ribokinase
MKSVVVLGDLVVDYTLAVERLPINAGEHQRIELMDPSPGGAANTLIMGTRLGLSMQAVGVVGQDDAGQWLRQALESQRINVDAVVPSADLRTAVVYCLVAPDGQHVFLGHQGGEFPEALSNLCLQAVRGASALFFDGWIYRGGYRAISMQAASHAFEHGIPVFFDVGPDYAHFDSAWVHNVLAHTHTLLATEDELVGLMAAGKSVESAAQWAIEQGVQRVIVKQGAQGAWLVSSEATMHHPSYPVEVRDTTGAGDAFAAAVIYAHLNDFPPYNTLKLANAVGAAAVARLGSGYNMPTRGDVLRILKMSGDDGLLAHE